MKASPDFLQPSPASGLLVTSTDLRGIVRKLLRRIGKLIANWVRDHNIRRAEIELERMSDRMLNDIGLSRFEIRHGSVELYRLPLRLSDGCGHNRGNLPPEHPE